MVADLISRSLVKHGRCVYSCWCQVYELFYNTYHRWEFSDSDERLMWRFIWRCMSSWTGETFSTCSGVCFYSPTHVNCRGRQLVSNVQMQSRKSVPTDCYYYNRTGKLFIDLFVYLLKSGAILARYWGCSNSLIQSLGRLTKKN